MVLLFIQIGKYIFKSIKKYNASKANKDKTLDFYAIRIIAYNILMFSIVNKEPYQMDKDFHRACKIC